MNIRVIPATSLPKSTGLADNADLATVTVQIAYNPGNQALTVSSASATGTDPLRSLWTGTVQGKATTVPIVTYVSFVGRNL